MCNTTGLIAEGLVEDAQVEHPVVDDEEEDGPFHERPVEALHTFLDEGRLVVEVFQREEVAGRDEEQGHVELEDELAQPSWGFCVGDDHQDNGDALGDGNSCVSFHLFTFSPLQPRGEQMTQPASEPFPGAAAAFVFLICQEVTLLCVLDELLFQLVRHVLVDDDGVDLVIEAQAAGVEVRAADGTVLAVDHHDLRVVEARTVAPDAGSALHQLNYI